MKIILTILVITILAPHKALAWGEEGHKIVAQIAQDHLLPTTRANIKALTGSGASIVSMATWADKYRLSHPETKRWHTVGIPLSKDVYDPSRDCKQVENKGDCIVNEINRAQATLADPNAELKPRIEALKFLVHFIGDVHQPIHCVKKMKGASDADVRFFNVPMSLHKVWDSAIIARRFRNEREYARWLEQSWLPGKNIAGLSSGSVVDWAQECHKAGKAAFDMPTDGNLDDGYYARAIPVVDRQLAIAGLRLARILNDSLGASQMAR